MNLILLTIFSDQGKNLSILPFGTFFGFNGNILETNIINLAVVIGIVVFFGGDALRSLLKNRKETIFSSLQEADSRAKEAMDKLSKAKSQLSLFQKKAYEIRQQASGAAEQEKKQAIQQTQEDTQRLEQVKQETLQMQQQKTISQISQQVVFFALDQVRDKLKKRLDTSFHSAVNRFYVALFTNYSPQ